jgi:hypothetical protein
MIGFALLLLAFGVPASQAQENTFYSTGNFGSDLFAIHITGRVVTMDKIGAMGGGVCPALAMAPWGALYAMCGALFGTQHLATINTTTGAATLFGTGVPGLAVMAMAFAPNGTLYAVGDCNPNGTDCSAGADPTYNSLYTVDPTTGAFTRIGSTGATEYFMDLAFDRSGNLFGVTSTLRPSYSPATMYRIDTTTGAATKVVDLVGGTAVMGLSFGADGKLYATDFVARPGLYQIDMDNGFETAIAAMPATFTLSSSLELAVPLGAH